MWWNGLYIPHVYTWLMITYNSDYSIHAKNPFTTDRNCRYFFLSPQRIPVEMARFLFIVADEWSCNKVHIGWCVWIKRCFLMYTIFQEQTSIVTKGVPLNFVWSVVSHCRWRQRFYYGITDSNKNILENMPNFVFSTAPADGPLM